MITQNSLPSLQDQTIVVFGASGFIGSQVVETLASMGVRIRAIGRHINKAKVVANARAVEWVHADLQLNPDFSALCAGADAVIYLAASIPVSYRSHDFSAVTSLQINVAGAWQAAVSSLHSRARKFIHASTTAVYGRPRYLPVDEEHPLEADDYYGASKALAERFLDRLSTEEPELELVHLRIGAPYGPCQEANALIPNAIRAALRQDTLTIAGDGSQRREYIYRGDVAQAILRALAPGVRGTFHVTSGESVAINDVLTDIERISGHEIERRYDPEISTIPEFRFDISRMREALGDFVLTSREKGLRATIGWFADNGTAF